MTPTFENQCLLCGDGITFESIHVCNRTKCLGCGEFLDPGQRHDCPSPPELKKRPGDQPLPVINEHPYVQDAVIDYIEKRKQIGISRYGTALQPHNGRDAMRDAFEEVIDLAVYLAQVIIERDGSLFDAQADSSTGAHSAP